MSNTAKWIAVALAVSMLIPGAVGWAAGHAKAPADNVEQTEGNTARVAWWAPLVVAALVVLLFREKDCMGWPGMVLPSIMYGDIGAPWKSYRWGPLCFSV